MYAINNEQQLQDDELDDELEELHELDDTAVIVYVKRVAF